MNRSKSQPGWHILHIDDDEAGHLLIRSMLADDQRKSITLDWADNLADGRSRLLSGHYQAVLVEYRLCASAGLELLREFVEQDYGAPFLLLNGQDSDEEEQKALEAGACMHLAKSELTPRLLERSLRCAIERQQMELDLRKKTDELQAARAKIEDEKHRLEAVMAALPVGVAITDAQGGSIQANPAYEQVWGGAVRPARSVTDYAAYQAWWADSGQLLQPEEWASAQAVLKGEAVQGQILEIQRFDGRRSFVLNSAAPVRNSKGQITGSAVAIQDIGPLKWSEALSKALVEINQVLLSTLRLDEIMHQAISIASKALGSETAAISLIDRERWVVRYIYGFSPGIIGVQMNNDEERHAVLAIQTQEPVAVSDAFSDERVNQEHLRKWGVRSVLVVPILMRKQAIGVMFFNYQTSQFDFLPEHIQFGVNLAASISAALENTRLFASLENEISEREKTAQALRESEQRWAATLTSIGDGVIATDTSARVTFMNPVAEELTGWSLEEALGRSINEVFCIVNEQSRQPVANPVEEVLKQGVIVGLANHTLLIRKDGTEAPIDDSGAPIWGASGEMVGAVLVFRDISSRRRAEKMLQTYAHQLERSNKELENFAFVASHDLQEPLRKIQSFSRLIAGADPALGESERMYLERIEQAAARMSKMIEALLSLAKLSTQQQPYRPVDLHQTVRAVLDDLDVRIGQSGGQVEVGPLPVLQADPVQMHQLLQNLIGNALKFCRPNQPPQVVVSCEYPREGWVEISIQDNGTGFDMAQAGRLFQPFQRLHPRGEYDGAGIGLSICRKIVELHGGSISADSRPEHGTTFRILLPSGWVGN